MSSPAGEHRGRAPLTGLNEALRGDYSGRWAFFPAAARTLRKPRTAGGSRRGVPATTPSAARSGPRDGGLQVVTMSSRLALWDSFRPMMRNSVCSGLQLIAGERPRVHELRHLPGFGVKLFLGWKSPWRVKQWTYAAFRT